VDGNHNTPVPWKVGELLRKFSSEGKKEEKGKKCVEIKKGEEIGKEGKIRKALKVQR
jgi:hypothetical protein